MSCPDLLTYPRDKNPHILIEPIEGGAPPPYPASTVRKRIGEIGLLPIANDTTLPPDFYECVNIDERYPRDHRRLEDLRKLGTYIEAEQDPELKATMQRAHGYFAASLFEGDYLNYAFNETTTPIEDLTIQEKRQFFKPFDVHEIASAQHKNAILAAVPADIRGLAFKDLSTTHQVLGILDDLHLDDISTSKIVTDYLSNHGFDETTHEERIAVLQQHVPHIKALITEQKHQEHKIKYGLDKHAAQELVSKITNRKRASTDCVDGCAFGYYTNSGVIVDPAYLFNGRYATLLKEPMIDPRDTRQTVLHMMGGTYTYGHDHSYLYRNRNEKIPNSYIGTLPDYGAIRPGNFLYHDLRYLENSSIRANYTLGHLMQYLTAHYIEQKDMFTPVNVDKIPDDPAIDSFISTSDGDENYVTPLEKIDNHIIPFRALKKDSYSSDYFEYGKECYLAEMVDMAMECDVIAAKAHRPESTKHAMIGDVKVGYYASQLLHDVWSRTFDVEAVSTMIEQTLFMQGSQPIGGRGAIADYLCNSRDVTPQGTKAEPLDLTNIPVMRMYNEKGIPEEPHKPLTCYYEWFKRYARPVSVEELKQKGIPIRPPLLSIN